MVPGYREAAAEKVFSTCGSPRLAVGDSAERNRCTGIVAAQMRWFGENSLMRHGKGCVLGILPLSLARSSLGLGQDDRAYVTWVTTPDCRGVLLATAKRQRPSRAKSEWFLGRCLSSCTNFRAGYWPKILLTAVFVSPIIRGERPRAASAGKTLETPGKASNPAVCGPSLGPQLPRPHVV